MDISFSTEKSIGYDDKFYNFSLNLYNLVDKHCPKIRLNKKKLKLRTKPWINNRISKMMKIRLFQQLKSTNSETNLIRTFKLFQNHVVNELKESKKNYFYHYFD